LVQHLSALVYGITAGPGTRWDQKLAASETLSGPQAEQVLFNVWAEGEHIDQ
jgi:hypothetical protein